jgi:hypothetical protein
VLDGSFCAASVGTLSDGLEQDESVIGLIESGLVHVEDADLAAARMSLLRVTAEDPGVRMKSEK